MRKEELDELHYITPIDNVASILRREIYVTYAGRESTWISSHARSPEQKK